MKSGRIIGIIMSVAGLAMLAVNAWNYLENTNHRYITSAGGVIFCITGALLIRKSRISSDNENKN